MKLGPLTHTVLLLDAIGCAIGSLLVLFSPVWDLLDLPDDARMPIALALAAFAGLLYATAREPSDALLTACAVGNVFWVVGGAFALAIVDRPISYVIILAVMVADALMGWLQLQPVIQRNLV